MPTLTVQLPGAAPVSHVLKDETSTVGRMKGNTVVIEDASISLMHARITRRNGEFFLKDLNSTNGTMVNGQPISEVKLRDKDRIRFADVTTQFDTSDALVSGEAPTPVTVGRTQVPTAVALPLPSTAANPATASSTAIPFTPLASAPAPRQAMAAPAHAASAPAPATRPLPASVPAGSRSTSRKKRKSKLVAPLALAACIVFGVGGYIGYNEFAVKGEKVAARDVTVPLASHAAAERSNPRVSGKAATAAEPPAADVNGLAKGLKSHDVVERRKAATALHGLGVEAKQVSPELMDALKDSDSEVQMWAALTLSKNQVYDKAEVPILVRGLQHENAVLRQVVCLSMGLLPFEAAEKDLVVPALAEAVRKDADEDVRAAAQSALSVIAPGLVQNSTAPLPTSNSP
jgi:pSer/pThr/pTyr-binding forkhead associated (FHA) protein